MKPKQKVLDNLLSPSWLSGLIAVAAGLVVTAGTIVIFSFNNSQVQQQITSWQNTSAPALTLPGENPPGSGSNSLQNTWPLVGFWMIIGLIVYFIIEGLAHGLANAAEFKKELSFVHARRDAMIRNAVESVLLRVFSAMIWLVFIEIFFKRIIPYSITAAHASASDIRSPAAFLYSMLAFAMIALSLHAQTILLRLMAGRSRLLSLS